jgi:hypothetical protein
MSRFASRSCRILIASAGAFAFVACADSNRLTDPATPDFAQQSSREFAQRHVFHVKSYYANTLNGNSGKGTGIYYHGGPLLISATNVAAVYWANALIYTGGPTPGTFGSATQDNSLVGFFLRNLGGSPRFNINTTYYDGTGAHVQNVVNYTQTWANNQYQVPSNGQSVSDGNMVAMLQYGFNQGYLTYDPTTLYAIFTPGTVNLGGGFGTQYCAYHTYGTVTVNGAARRVLYTAMPYDYAYPNACTNGTASPNGDPGADAEVNTLTHEIEETTTDMYLNAWYDRRGYENADKCAWTWGTTYRTANGGLANVKVGGKDFLVQQNWVNAGSGGCAKSY